VQMKKVQTRKNSPNAVIFILYVYVPDHPFIESKSQKRGNPRTSTKRKQSAAEKKEKRKAGEKLKERIEAAATRPKNPCKTCLKAAVDLDERADKTQDQEEHSALQLQAKEMRERAETHTRASSKQCIGYKPSQKVLTKRRLGDVPVRTYVIKHGLKGLLRFGVGQEADEDTFIDAVDQVELYNRKNVIHASAFVEHFIVARLEAGADIPECVEREDRRCSPALQKQSIRARDSTWTACLLPHQTTFAPYPTWSAPRSSRFGTQYSHPPLI
jgi:hypothetical protein